MDEGQRTAPNPETIDAVNATTLGWTLRTAKTLWWIKIGDDARTVAISKIATAKARKIATTQSSTGDPSADPIEDEGNAMYKYVEGLCEREAARIAASAGIRKIQVRYEGHNAQCCLERMDIRDRDDNVRMVTEYEATAPITMTAQERRASLPREHSAQCEGESFGIVEARLNDAFMRAADTHVENSPDQGWDQDEGGQCVITWEMSEAGLWSVNEEISRRIVVYGEPGQRAIKEIKP